MCTKFDIFLCVAHAGGGGVGEGGGVSIEPVIHFNSFVELYICIFGANV